LGSIASLLPSTTRTGCCLAEDARSAHLAACPCLVRDELGTHDLNVAWRIAILLARPEPSQKGPACRLACFRRREEERRVDPPALAFSCAATAWTAGGNLSIPSPPCGPVPTRITRRTRSGRSNVTCWATKPPIEKPSRSICLSPSAPITPERRGLSRR